MRTLKLKEVVGYFPYGMYYEYVIIPSDWDGVTELKKDVDEYNIWDYAIEIVDLLTHRPVLRPLSDLYRPIVHNGKEIVPIVECAKASMPDHEWEAGDNYAIADIFDSSECRLKFRYYKTYGAFLIGSDAPENQYRIFDCLHELKIDYRGLIEAGLAIDANKLEINPYK